VSHAMIFFPYLLAHVPPVREHVPVPSVSAVESQSACTCRTLRRICSCLAVSTAPPISIRWVNNSKVKILIRKLLHSFHAVHVIKSEIKHLFFFSVSLPFLPVHFIRPMLCPRIAAVSFHAFAGRCVGDDVIWDVAGSEHWCDDVSAHSSLSILSARNARLHIA